MKQNIRFRGLSFNRDEQSADHGELSLCAGVELHDGALRPSVLEGSMVQHEAGGVMVDSELKVNGNIATLLYVHETPSYRHFIAMYDGKLYWFRADGTLGNSTAVHDFGSESVISISSVGNTLVVMTASGVHYILWKESDYKYLGTQIPYLPIEFRPTKQYRAKYDRSTINSDQVGESFSAWRQMPMIAYNTSEIREGAFNPNDQTRIVTINPDFQSPLTEAVHAIINQSNNTIAKDGHFYAPFMLRYCYRLYDGSMVMHSTPVFMNVIHPLSFKVYCNNIDVLDKKYNMGTGQYVPVENGHIGILNGNIDITYKEYDDGGVERDYTFHIDEEHIVIRYVPNNVGIEYHIQPDGNSSGFYNNILNSLRNDWGDIVKSVDVFVSAPIVREDMGELITQMVIEKPSYGARSWLLQGFENNIGREDDEGSLDPDMDPPGYYKSHYATKVIFDIPKLSDEQYLQKICDTSNFYKIASYHLDQLKVDESFSHSLYVDLDYDKSVIVNITAQEQMTDGYHTHNQLLPIIENSGMYVYNHRLNLYGMEEKLYEGHSVFDMINFCQDTRYDPRRAIVVNRITVEIDTEAGKKYVQKDVATAYSATPIDLYVIIKGFLFYPDSRATKMYIEYGNFNNVMVLPMEPLNFLNGAVAKGAFFKENMDDFITTPYAAPPSVNNIVPLPNRIITSEVDNPYLFPLNGRNAVGIGNVKGIAAVTRALSQGQVGDHDLVVFSTDGIWVLKVSSEGTYMSAHNISREVCSNPKSICQLDQSVIFATQRSLSKFVESDVQSISAMLDGPIPDLVNMFACLATSFPVITNTGKLLRFTTPAVDMFNNGTVFYDYASSRIVVLQGRDITAAGDSVAMVFSIRDMAWSTMMVPVILSVVPGYPSPFVQTTDGKVIILDKQYGYTGNTRKMGLVITRTLTFSDTMDVMRGFRQMTDSAEMPMLYFFGSNDQRTWRFIGNTNRDFHEYMPGHPYRFFRIALSMRLLPSEEYQQLELEVISKYAKL